MEAVDEARPSRTALRVALRRAAHQLYDERPLVFDDPFAVRILGPHTEELQRTPGRNPAYKARPYSVGLRALLVARSRFAEDRLAQAVTQAVTQYVLLGAGLDTFAHRNPHPQLRVFEVDHPATQRWKRDLLRESAIATPSNLVYAPVDFERQSLADELRLAGFDFAAPSFFAWLGVVPYLTREAFRATIALIAAQPRGSGVVFDYGQPREVLSPLEQIAHDSLAARVQQAGEQFRLFLTPQEIDAELQAFREIEDIGSVEINALYFADRTDKLRLLGSAARIVCARI
jgi:methyltransferase (TIGR00027 family)